MGAAQNPTWRSWRKMRDRCLNPNATGYKNYGGRGITICARWNDFANFLADMGKRPAGKSLDRIDSNGNYEPSNCRWATSKQQGASRRNLHMITLDGETHHLTEWARRRKIAHAVVRTRIYTLGWPAELALSLPSGGRGCNRTFIRAKAGANT